MLALLIALAAVAVAVITLVLVGEVQSTISFVLDRGGLWLNYSTGIGRLRLTGYQVRIMLGHHPRAWKRIALTNKFRSAQATEVYRETTSKEWNPIQIPLRSAVDIGVKVYIRELNVKAKIGVESDAAATALVCGALSTVLQGLRSASTRGEFVPRGCIDIRPVFGAGRLSVRFKCILAIKARHIIRETIRNHARRNNDGQSSDRKHHANHNGKHTQYG